MQATCCASEHDSVAALMLGRCTEQLAAQFCFEQSLAPIP